MIFKILFWLSVVLILHAYLLYPLLLLILDKLITGKHHTIDEHHCPAVSVLMAVHNEQQVIRQKIEALYSSDYPGELLEVLVGSDASDDQTDQILEELTGTYKSLRVFSSGERTGKPAVINVLSEKASGEILIITDANVLPARSTIKKLVSNFGDQTVGLADSKPLNTIVRKDGFSLPETAYLGFESKLKLIEGRIWGTMMGPFGGFYAVRKRSYMPNRRDTLADDFRIGMNVVSGGEKAIIDSEAIVYEDMPNSLAGEFGRKVRISAGNFQNLLYFSGLLLKPLSKIGFCFISHKVLRWLTPIFWIILITCNILLLKNSIFYQLFFLLQVIFLILPPLDILLKKAGINLVLLRFFTHLYLMNVALFTGLIRYLTGIRSGVWTPTKRV